MWLIIDELAYILRTTNFDYHNPYYPNHDLQYESGTNIESFRYFQIQNHDLCFKNRHDRLIVINIIGMV
jgi:hypothetical protein